MRVNRGIEMKNKAKGWVICIAALFLATAAVLGGIKLYRIYQRDQCGILLAFDDYNSSNWEEYFDLFDEYGVKVTFFINAEEPTDFCYRALERGHEIAFHTVEHADLREVSQEEIYRQAIAPIEVFREKGIDLTTFAYPYGHYSEELNEMLLEHYTVVRGAYALQVNNKHALRGGFVESMSLDNVNYESQEAYEAYITEILTQLKQGKANVISMYSHAIAEGDWCVSPDKLRFLFQKADELGLQFYTFQYLQNW